LISHVVSTLNTDASGRALDNKTHPRRILDAGGDRGVALSVGLHRILGSLSEGQALEVISRNASSQVEIPIWCARTGNALVHAEAGDDDFVYWIVKVTAPRRWSHL
jgi:TusA-related sulfurtransferase